MLRGRLGRRVAEERCHKRVQRFPVGIFGIGVRFVRHLLDDVQALEYMIENDWFESNITRIGAEQEMCMVWNKTEVVSKQKDSTHVTVDVSLSKTRAHLKTILSF